MFYSSVEPEFILESVDASGGIHQILEESYLAFQCFMESHDPSVLMETSYAKNKFIQIIEAILNYIKNALTKLIAAFDSRLKNMDTLIEKYRPQLEALTDSDLKGMVYDRIDYTISANVPAVANFDLVMDGLNTLSSHKVSRSAVELLRNKITIQLPSIRAQIMGVSRPVKDGDVDNVIEGLFKHSYGEYQTKLTKKDLMEILEDVHTFPKVRQAMGESEVTVTRMLNSFKTQINRIYSVEPTMNSDEIKITAGDTTHTANPVQAVYYKEYQMLLANFIMDLTNLYSSIYDAKLTALQEKFSREQAIIRETIYLIQGKK